MYSFDRIIFLSMESFWKLSETPLPIPNRFNSFVAHFSLALSRLPASIFISALLGNCVRKELEKISTKNVQKKQQRTKKTNQITSCYIQLPEFKYGFFGCEFVCVCAVEFHITGITEHSIAMDMYHHVRATNSATFLGHNFGKYRLRNHFMHFAYWCCSPIFEQLQLDPTIAAC